MAAAVLRGGRLASLLSLVVVLGDLVQGPAWGAYIVIITTGVISRRNEAGVGLDRVNTGSRAPATAARSCRIVDRAGGENRKEKKPPAMSEDESTYVRSAYLCRRPPEK